MSFRIRINWEERKEIFCASVNRKNTISHLENLIRSNRKANKLLSSSDEIIFTLDKVTLNKDQQISSYSIRSCDIIKMHTVADKHLAALSIEKKRKICSTFILYTLHNLLLTYAMHNHFI